MPKATSRHGPRRAWIGLGANLGDARAAVARALHWLDACPDLHLEAASRLHRTAPIGPPQPDYVNAVARVRTTLAPEALLLSLQSMERAAARRRTVRWGPRTLDLDLLLYDDGHGQVRLASPTLTLPHPELARRRFVLGPLAELDPDLRHPVLDRSVTDLLETLASLESA